MDKSLLAIIEVPYDLRVRCGAPGCGHSVHRRVHIVKLGGSELRIYGSTCFAREFAGLPILSTRPQLTGNATRLLSAEERELLVSNSQRLIARFEEEQAAIREQQLRKPIGRVPVRPAGSSPLSVGRTQFSQEERAAVEPEALRNLSEKFRGLNFYSPGFNGLLQSEIDRILRLKTSASE